MKLKRLSAVFLSCAMIIGMMPVLVFAREIDCEPDEAGTEEVSDPEEKQTEEKEPEDKVSEAEEAEDEDADDSEDTDVSYVAEGKMPVETDKVTSKMASGKIGKKLKWKFNGTTLTISGKGKMPNWSSAEKVPWHKYRSSIRKFVIKKGVKSIGAYAFYDCTLRSGKIYGNTVRSIGAYAFCSTNVSSFQFPKSVRTIGESAFEGSLLDSVRIPKGVKKIADWTFADCLYLKSVSLPSSVKWIGYSAFSNCAKLENITLPSGLKSIGGSAFYHTHITSFKLPAGVTKIEDNAFEFCVGLKELTIPYGVTSIGEKAFASCYNIEKLTIASSVSSIGKQAFLKCSMLEEVNIEEGLKKSLDESVFEKCTKLTEESFNYLADNPMTVTAKDASVKYKNAKKKNQTIAVSKIFTFEPLGNGPLIFSKVSGNKKITIARSTGKITVKKKIKKGTYTIKVKVVAAGDSTYKASDENIVTFKIKVR